MNFGQRRYRKRIVNHGLHRSICIELDTQIWEALDEIARKLDVNKCALLRPKIKQVIEENCHLLIGGKNTSSENIFSEFV